MKKSILVIVKEDKRAEDPRTRIKAVSAGYAFNYLIPKKMAEIATKGKIKHINMLYNMTSKKRDSMYSEKIKTKNKVENIGSIRIRRKCSTNQLIFGRISIQDIAKQIFQLTGEKIDRKHITVTDRKKLGKCIVDIKIGDSIKSSISLHIIPKTI